MNRKAYKLTPALSDRLWGGVRLKEYGKDKTAGRIAESWELSFHPSGCATVDGTPVTEVFDRRDFGTLCERFERFPVLTKFIDAKENLSVQVHPSDAYALENENSYGKTEMWVIVECEEGAGLYLGLKKAVGRDEFSRAIEEGRVEELLSFVPVKPGEVYFIPAGTLHAIGGGVLLYEIQQNSDLTYRVYDYNRRDASGKLRELHVEAAMKVADLVPYESTKISGDDPALIGDCEYFKTRIYKEKFTNKAFFVDESSYLAITALSGEGELDGQKIQKGDTFFIPAGAGEVTLSGELIVVTVGMK